MGEDEFPKRKLKKFCLGFLFLFMRSRGLLSSFVIACVFSVGGICIFQGERKRTLVLYSSFQC